MEPNNQELKLITKDGGIHAGLNDVFFSELLYEVEHMDFACNIEKMNVNIWKRGYRRMNDTQKTKFGSDIILLADKFPEKASLLYTVIQ